MRNHRSPLLVIVALALMLGAAGCARAKNAPQVSPQVPEPTASVDATAPVGPIAAATPEAAVVQYLRVVSQAYYSLDSTLVAPYVTADQWVREDAYMQLNLTQNQAIEMTLLEFGVTAPPSTDSSTTTLETRERWRWRYWDLKTRNPKTDWAETGYSVRYTLAFQGGGWLVDGTEVLEQSGETSPTLLP